VDGKRLEVSPGMDKEQFLREHDIDLFTDDGRGLYGIDIKVMSAEWNPQIPYEQLAGQLRSSNRYTLYGLSGVCFTSPGTTPAYWFETRTGLEGILQITGFTDNPRGVKLRYKLVQNSSTTTSPVSLPTDANHIAAPGERWAAALSRNGHSTLVVTADADVKYALYYEGAFNSTLRGSHDLHYRQWNDDGVLELVSNGRTFAWHCESFNPDLLSVNGREFNLPKGRLFVLQEDGTVKQLAIFPTVAQANDPDALVKLQMRGNVTHGYAMERGDNLVKIAKRFGMTIAELKALNPDLNPGRLRIGQQVMVYGASTVEISPQLAFGPVVERDLTDDVMIDFESGKSFGNFPDFVQKPGYTVEHIISNIEWMWDRGIDFYFTGGAVCIGSKVIALLPNDFTNISATALIRQLAQTEAGGPPAIPVHYEPNVLFTFGFQTHQGSFGLLQLTGFTDNPRGVKLRYKLVQNGTNAIPIESKLPTAAFQIRRVADDSDNSAATDTVTNFLDANHVASLRLLPGVLLDGKAVEDAGWSAADGRTNLLIGLTEAGSQQYEELTATNLQHRIAMIFQGRVLFAPNIQAAIHTRSLRIPVNWDMKDLERTMNGLNQMNNPVVNLRFGPEQESILPPLNGNRTFLNFRANRLFSSTNPDYESRAFHDWQRANGADVNATVGQRANEAKIGTLEEENFPALVTYDMATAPAIANGLDNASPADIWYNWSLMTDEPSAQTYLVKPPTNGPDTYYFRTRDGALGVLQITGFTENPRGVKIRYKLVQNGW
jgi:LysM repeat protein